MAQAKVPGSRWWLSVGAVRVRQRVYIVADCSLEGSPLALPTSVCAAAQRPAPPGVGGKALTPELPFLGKRSCPRAWLARPLPALSGPVSHSLQALPSVYLVLAVPKHAGGALMY